MWHTESQEALDWGKAKDQFEANTYDPDNAPEKRDFFVSVTSYLISYNKYRQENRHGGIRADSEFESLAELVAGNFLPST